MKSSFDELVHCVVVAWWMEWEIIWNELIIEKLLTARQGKQNQLNSIHKNDTFSKNFFNYNHCFK